MSKSISSIRGSTPTQAKLIFNNLTANYIVVGTELLIGVFMLPFNVAYLGKTAYGLWVLVASITFYFSMLDAGYGLAQVRFVAKYKAEDNTQALNELASTMFWVFSAIGFVALSIAVVVSLNLQNVFHLTSDQVRPGRIVFLLISLYVVVGFPLSVFGGVVNGFQRSYLNGVIAVATALLVAAVNIIVLVSGYGLVELVAATTTVRLLSYIGYAFNAYRVFPDLHIRARYFSWNRLRQITGFSVFILLIDLANKLNYSTDTIVIGAFMGTAAVALWAVAQRLIEIIQRITDQLNAVLFPVVVDSSTIQNKERLQNILLQGTRLSFAMVIPLATIVGILAKSIVFAWVGSSFSASVPILYVLTIVVSVRVGTSTSAVILKGAGRHRLVAISNITTALFNLGLSILLVQRYGLIGVAIGTLVPMLLMPSLVLFPAACRTVGISVLTVLRESVWPAIWPAFVITLILVFSREMLEGNRLFLIVQAGLAALVYLSLFLRFAISRDERVWYFGKAREILSRA